MESTLTRLPCEIRAGTTVEYTRTFAEYPADDGWTLTLYLRGKSALNEVGVAAGDAFDFTLSATETATLEPGDYQWIEMATKVGVGTYEADTGQTTVLQNLVTAAAGDAQSPLEKELEAVEAMIAARLGVGGGTPDEIQSYQIHGRAVTKREDSTLSTLYRRQAQLQEAIRREKCCGQYFNQVLARFTRPGVGCP